MYKMFYSLNLMQYPQVRKHFYKYDAVLNNQKDNIGNDFNYSYNGKKAIEMTIDYKTDDRRKILRI